VTSNNSGRRAGRGGPRYLPYAFTEHGVAMLSSVLNSERAIAVNILIMRAFVRMRRSADDIASVKRHVEDLARVVHGHDDLIAEILAALRALAEPPSSPPRRIGFRPRSES
jgi:hypothetical protein